MLLPMRRNRLARMRVAAGISSAEKAAKMIGCSRIHLLNVERGATGPSDELLAKIARAYGSTPEEVRSAIAESRHDLLKRQLEANKDFL